mmetsp:Transcript_29259/g.68774  ORF Transcript_29259/g.68774 Transcript_29259/m.68774 type:complete len:423 (-) Transcript_29259:984-2252(-)
MENYPHFLEEHVRVLISDAELRSEERRIQQEADQELLLDNPNEEALAQELANEEELAQELAIIQQQGRVEADSRSSSSSSSSSSDSDEDSDETETDSEDSDTDKTTYSSSSSMVYSKVPKFPTGEDPDFEGWYLDFQAHASRNKYLGMAINVLDPNLPDGELAVAYESLTKEQKKALKKHTNCLNDLYTAFANNNICFSLFAKSMRDKDATAEQNKVTIAKWPRGRVHRVFDELFDIYRKSDNTDRAQLELDKATIEMGALESPANLFNKIYGLSKKYQHKNVKPTDGELLATVLNKVPPYLVIPLTQELKTLEKSSMKDNPYAVLKALEESAMTYYRSMVVMRGRGRGAREMSLFGSEMLVGVPNSDARDRWSSNAICYWCREVGHKAYQCPRKLAGLPNLSKQIFKTRIIKFHYHSINPT